MTRLCCRRIGFCLALAVLTACGIKGDPVPPDREPGAEIVPS